MAVLAAVGTVLLIAFLLWFVVGTQRNISRGNELLRWLQGGLPLLGPRTTLRWLGTSAVQLDIVDAAAPFTRAQVNVVLEPRDLGWLWAWARRRGRRDFLILRGTLAGPPRFELEAGGRGWTGTERLDRLDQSAWQRTTWEDGAGTVDVAHTDRVDADDLAAVRALWQELVAASGGPWRLSIRHLEPQVEVHIEPPAVTPAPTSWPRPAGHEPAADRRPTGHEPTEREPAGRGGGEGADGKGAQALVGVFTALGRLASRDT